MMFSMGPFLFFLCLGVFLIVAELLIFNLSVFWFLFIGLGAISAALVAWLMPELGWVAINGVFILASALISLVLYRPFNRWQESPGPIAGNDAIGQVVDVMTPIDAGQTGSVNWSGAKWRAKLAEGSAALTQGDQAEIVAIDGIVLSVKRP